MRTFIIRAEVRKQVDPFFMEQATGDGMHFICRGLPNLRKTLRHLIPIGYRVRKSGWWGKYLNLDAEPLQLRSLFGSVMFQVKEVSGFGFKTVDLRHKNNRDSEIDLKIIVEPDYKF